MNEQAESNATSHGSTDFDDALTRWLTGYDKILETNRLMHYPNTERQIVFTETLQRYIRVTTYNECVAFIALQDFETKQLGKVRRGDVLKPASFKAPARHARGNIFDSASGLGEATPYGMASRRYR